MITEYQLVQASPQAWIDTVMADFDSFLIDHALCEKKAAGMAISTLSQHPDKTTLVAAMSELAVEEMMHFREVIKLIQNRSLVLSKDEKDPYIKQLRSFASTHQDRFLLDRLLMGSVVEARGAERFQLVADALAAYRPEEIQLAKFYKAIAQSEARHYTLFLELAYEYYSADMIAARLDEWLHKESEIMLSLALRPALH